MILDLYFEEGIVRLCKTLALGLVPRKNAGKGREKMNWVLGCCNFVLVLLHVMKYLKFNKGLNVFFS